MKVEFVDFIVEEPSMEAFLRTLLPRLLADIPFSIYPFQSKDELLHRLPDRLRGYAAWLPENHRIVIMVDRDNNDCQQLKQELERICQTAGLFTRNRRNGEQFVVINRILVEELEAWYFGDWDAVYAAYPGVSKTIPKQRDFRNSDDIQGGTWEAFERILQKASYFKTGLRKVEVARTIAKHMDPVRNTSRSFKIWHTALQEFLGP